ncbi:MAG: DnaA/Hda family protein [Alphaproteobacteria bacterium]
MSALRQIPLPLAHRPALGADDFLVADGNRAAVAWLDRWPDWPHPALAIVGDEAAGKTHLARVFARRADAVLLNGSAVDSSAVTGLSGSPPSAVVIDDADEVTDEAALLHLYNVLADAGGKLLLTARDAPARWGLRLADLRSRLLAAPVAVIAPPDDALLQAVIAKLFADRGVAVDPDVVGYVAARIERSFAAAQRAVATLDAHSLAAGRRVTAALVRRALPGLFLDNDREPKEG